MDAYDPETWSKVRRAIASGDYTQLWTMIPAMDGGQSYEMACKICGGYGNAMGGPFYHEDGCPVPVEEARDRRRRASLFYRVGRWLKDSVGGRAT